MANPLFSIFIPVYNGEIWLKRTLESLKGQTFTTFEVLLYDDKSSDQSVDLIKDIISDDNRFVLIYGKQNVGLVPKIVKEHLHLLNGTYFMYMSQDDFLDHEALQKAANDISINNSDVSLFDFCYYSENKKSFLNGNNHDYSPIDGKKAFLLSLNWSIAGAGFYSLSFIRNVGYEDFNMYADEYSVRKFFVNSNLVSFNGGVFYYNIDNPDAVTRQPKPALFSKLYKETKILNLYKSKIGVCADFYKKLEKLIQMFWDYRNCTSLFIGNSQKEVFNLMLESQKFFYKNKFHTYFFHLKAKAKVQLFFMSFLYLKRKRHFFNFGR